MQVKSAIAVTVSLVLASGTANALVFGGSNLGVLGYPKHTCSAPSKPYDLSDEYAVNRYNSDLDYYIDCIKAYVENAKNDIERINESANDAIREANSL
ncbi:MAG: hypothetical protein IOC82_15585 [Aestuariivirga sp.]|uniref:hypothetical protein n=1 Tax=Aestuariivirga sp. TaxID=2650926 RepID=UPI0025BFC565|nr:hypothetical protein [Aestuariivirga sp.]MCA3562444.1 hypothetical protein [Aestuariivirga sp.]